jgi:hypothetical protein
MAETQIWRAARIRAADGRASTASRPSHRAGLRLWTFLNAQTLLNGPAGTPDGVVAVVEDDRRRLAARREKAGPGASQRS